MNADFHFENEGMLSNTDINPELQELQYGQETWAEQPLQVQEIQETEVIKTVTMKDGNTLAFIWTNLGPSLAVVKQDGSVSLLQKYDQPSEFKHIQTLEQLRHFANATYENVKIYGDGSYSVESMGRIVGGMPPKIPTEIKVDSAGNVTSICTGGDGPKTITMGIRKDGTSYIDISSTK